MATCSDLYNAGVPFLLRFRCRVKPGQIPQFYQFLQSKPPACFLALRDLSLCSFNPYSGPDAVDPLANILNRGKNIRRIQLIGYVLSRSPILYEAVASSSSLRHLGLLGVYSPDAPLLKMLLQLQSPLTTLKLGELTDELDLITTLANFERTLEELELQEATLCYSSRPLCYSQLTYLHLTCVKNLRLSFFIPAFPNLRTLEFSYSGSDVGDEAEELRDSNIHFQQDHPSQRWYLTSLMADVGSLYVLGLQSEVPDVAVTHFSPDSDARIDDVDICLTPFRPLRLSFQNDLEEVQESNWLANAISYGLDELVRLHLSFTFVVGLGDHQARLDDLFGKLSLVSTTKHRLFVLDVEMCDRQLGRESRSAHDFLDNLEMDTLADRAFQAVPTLKVVKLAINSAKARVTHWKNEGGTFTHIESEDQAEAIIDSIVSPLLRGFVAHLQDVSTLKTRWSVNVPNRRPSSRSTSTFRDEGTRRGLDGSRVFDRYLNFDASPFLTTNFKVLRFKLQELRATITLNLDILRHVLTFVETHKDLLSAMSTCHALYNAGILPLILLPIIFEEPDIRSFHDFMLSHSPASFIAFRQFYLDLNDDLPDADIPLIIELLERGTNLQSLNVPYDIFELGAHDGAAEAITKLTRLEEFTVTGPMPRSCEKMLSHLQSPLVSIDGYFDWPNDGHADPVLLLSNFQHSLEDVGFYHVVFSSTAFHYPKVTCLSLSQCDTLPLPVLTTVFPNLKELTISYSLAQVTTEQIEELRSQNLAFHESEDRWASLTSVTADIVSLYVMGLQNSLSSLDITSLSSYSPVHDSYLRTLISTTKTRSLSLDLPDIPGALSTPFKDGLAAPLSSLDLRISFGSSNNPDKTLEDLLEGLAFVSTVHLSVELRLYRVVQCDAGGLSGARPRSNRNILSCLDEESFVKRIGAVMRSVAFISVKNLSRRTSHWMNTESELTKSRWTKVALALDEDAAKDGLTGFFSRTLSTASKI
ncbi:hypothetical protein EIP86_010691 [Pleurotus ostreatoroseus]|nr:hypothetical protein EIP86_010691 [Pleurotus ostreatoroseus]